MRGSFVSEIRLVLFRMAYAWLTRELLLTSLDGQYSKTDTPRARITPIVFKFLTLRSPLGSIYPSCRYSFFPHLSSVHVDHSNHLPLIIGSRHQARARRALRLSIST